MSEILDPNQIAAQEAASSENTQTPEAAKTEANATEDTSSETSDATPEGGEKPQKNPNRALLRRIAEELERRRQAEARLAELQAKTGNQPGAAAPDIDTLVDQRFQQREQQRIAKEIYDYGKQNLPDYDTAVYNLSAALGDKVSDQAFLDAVFLPAQRRRRIDKLGNDLEAADEIAGLSPVKMAMKLAQISGSIKGAGQSKPAAGSSAPPAPIKPVGSTNAAGAAKPIEKMSVAELDAHMRKLRAAKQGR